MMKSARLEVDVESRSQEQKKPGIKALIRLQMAEWSKARRPVVSSPSQSSPTSQLAAQQFYAKRIVGKVAYFALDPALCLLSLAC
jgi:hypothetical protein